MKSLRCVWLSAACVVASIDFAGGATVGSGGDPDETTLTGVTAAAWIRNDQSTRRAGPETLFVGGASAGANDFRAYLSFDLSNLEGTVSGATLSVWSQGATTFNANGGVNDLGLTPLNVVSMPDTITGWGESGFQGADFNSAIVDGSGDPADYANASPLYGAVIGTASFDIDTIAEGTRMDITFSDLSAVQSALGGVLTVGLEAPDAVALATSSAARNFFALAGVNENTSTAGNDVPPSLEIRGVSAVPEPSTVMLLVLCASVAVVMTRLR